MFQDNSTLTEVTCSQVDSHNAVKITSMECSSSNSSIDEDVHFSKNVNSEPCNLLPNSDVPDGNSTGSKSQTTTSSVADGIMIRGPLPSQVTSIQTKKIDGSSHFISAVKSNDVHLSIRMPNGISLQTKLTVEDTLSSVKIFVDERIDHSIGSYDLAVPYPRKLFNGEGTQPFESIFIFVPTNHVNNVAEHIKSCILLLLGPFQFFSVPVRAEK